MLKRATSVTVNGLVILDVQSCHKYQ